MCLRAVVGGVVRPRFRAKTLTAVHMAIGATGFGHQAIAWFPLMNHRGGSPASRVRRWDGHDPSLVRTVMDASRDLRPRPQIKGPVSSVAVFRSNMLTRWP